MAVGGTVYLLHFTQPYVSQSGRGVKVARHYLGATGLPLEERLAAHRGIREYAGDISYGRPSRLLTAVLAAGGDWVVADVWETATRAEAFALEKRIKAHHNSTAYCSICNPGNRRGTGSKWPGKGKVD